jgi:hypothetical protein
MHRHAGFFAGKHCEKQWFPAATLRQQREVDVQAAEAG